MESYLKTPFPPDEVRQALPPHFPNLIYPAQVPALRLAAAKGHAEVVQLLLLASADMDKTDQNEGLETSRIFPTFFLVVSNDH